MTATAQCYECKRILDEEYFCHGCKQYICEGTECGRRFPFTMADQIGHGHDAGMHFMVAEGYDNFGERLDG